MKSSAMKLLADLMKDAPLEKWIEYAEMTNKNWWSLQNHWMSNVEKKYGPKIAIEFDDIVYGSAIETCMYRLRKFFDFSGEDDLSLLAKVYQLVPAGSYIDIEWTRISDTKLLRQVRSCPMQIRRREEGLPELPCKAALVAALPRIAKVINPKMKISDILCPPDPHPEDLWCSATFELNLNDRIIK